MDRNYVRSSMSTGRRALAGVATVGFLALASGVALAGPSDLTAPVISRQVTGSAGDDGWFRGPVNRHGTVTDPESPWTTSGCDARTIDSDTAGAAVECRASSAGGSASDAMVVKVDSSAPSVTG